MAELFPSVTVTAQQRDDFYLATAHRTGYFEGTEESPERDPSNWLDTAAIAEHVRQHMIQMARRNYRWSQSERASLALPDADSYDLGVTP